MLAIFTTMDSDLKNRNNYIVEIIRQLTNKECDIADVGYMYKIKFQDGFITDAFEDELIFL
jgi:hypothetical protein